MVVVFLETGFRTFSTILFLRVSDIAQECSHTEAWIRSRLYLSEPRPMLSVLDRRLSQMFYAKKNELSCHLGLRIDTYAYADADADADADTSTFAGEKERRFNKQVDGICLREITVLVAKEQHRVSLT